MATKTNVADEFLAALAEAAAIQRGELEPARVHLPPDWIDVRAIRVKTGLAREAFATRFGLKLAAVRDWEQGLRKPDPAARTLLRVIDRYPEAVLETVAAEAG